VLTRTQRGVDREVPHEHASSVARKEHDHMKTELWKLGASELAAAIEERLGKITPKEPRS